MFVVFDAPTVKGGIGVRLAAAQAALSATHAVYARVHEHQVCLFVCLFVYVSSLHHINMKYFLDLYILFNIS